MSEQLTLPTMYEDIRRELKSSGESYIAKLMEFVKPVESAESELSEVAMQMRQGSGRVVFLLGEPGSGKSTFIESLTWRQHLPFSNLEEIDCESMTEDVMDQLLKRINHIAETDKPRSKSDRFTAVTVNYMENLKGIKDKNIKSFFRSLNGILRKSPLLIVWPVTSERDANEMMSHAKEISNTMFYKDKEIIRFEGP